MTPYTHAMWRVQSGRETEFIQAWEALADAFSALDGKPLWGTLLRSVEDPSVFYSFGPWRNEADIAAMRATAEAVNAIGKLVALCVEATPRACALVRHVDLEQR